MVTQRLSRLGRFWPLAPVGLAGVVVGVILWGGFNTAMEATNSLEFCISCHEMRNTVYKEYKTTVHYRNPSGVRAICSDCHVPKDWTHKVLRKIQASQELYHKLVGSIDTPEKFAAKRIDLARHEWARMKASDSRECRNCHGYDAMDFHKQRPKSADAMVQAAKDGKTCIDCHKGIAHKLPDMAARHTAQFQAITAAAAGAAAKPGEHLVAFAAAPFHLDRPAAPGAEPDGELAALTPVAVLAREGDWLRVEFSGWQREGSMETFYARQGRRIPAASLEPKALAAAAPIRTVVDPATEQTWTEAKLSAWVPAARFTADEAALAAYGAELYDSTCAFCHTLPDPASRAANDWIGAMNAMRRFVNLNPDQHRFLQKYLQLRAKDTAGGS